MADLTTTDNVAGTAGGAIVGGAVVSALVVAGSVLAAPFTFGASLGIPAVVLGMGVGGYLGYKATKPSPSQIQQLMGKR